MQRGDAQLESFQSQARAGDTGTSLLGQIPTCLSLTSAPTLSFCNKTPAFPQALAHTMSAAWIILSSVSFYFLPSSSFKAKFPGHRHAKLPSQWIPLSSVLLLPGVCHSPGSLSAFLVPSSLPDTVSSLCVSLCVSACVVYTRSCVGMRCGYPQM